VGGAPVPAGGPGSSRRARLATFACCRELLRAGLRALSNAELAQVLLRLDELNESSTSLSVLVRDLADRVETEVEGS
jgi:hypothetical protein